MIFVTLNMGLAELKAQLHQRIDSVDDAELLSAINELLANDTVYEIPEKYVGGIEEGMRDYQRGDYMTLKEFEVKYQKWLKG